MSGDFRLERGQAPLLLSIPHCGVELPVEVQLTMTAAALSRADTDWHVDRLYGFARALDVTVLSAHWHRYAVDLNRPADDAPMYPGRFGTGVVPAQRFDGAPLYATAPTAAESSARVDRYWRPYHAALGEELARLSATHSTVVLIDAHSIARNMPTLFDGDLPDFNFGTADGLSADPALLDAFARIVATDGRYSQVCNGRFKGGFITRHYGRAGGAVQSLQIELVQESYGDRVAGVFCYDPAKAEALQPLLEALLQHAIDYARMSTRGSG